MFADHPMTAAIQDLDAEMFISAFLLLIIIMFILRFAGRQRRQRLRNPTGMNKVRPQKRDQTCGEEFPVIPIDQGHAAGSRPYRIVGVDQKTGMDAILQVRSVSAANAKAMGEMHGLVVTDVIEEPAQSQPGG